MFLGAYVPICLVDALWPILVVIGYGMIRALVDASRVVINSVEMQIDHASLTCYDVLHFLSPPERRSEVMHWILQNDRDNVPMAGLLDRMGIAYSVHSKLRDVAVPELVLDDPNRVVVFGYYSAQEFVRQRGLKARCLRASPVHPRAGVAAISAEPARRSHHRQGERYRRARA
jgi:hypothetical protein